MKILKNIKDFIVGYFIGIANLIPGISGGTAALIFGIFQRLLNCVNQINGKFFTEFIENFRNNSNKLQSIHFFLKKKDFYFLIRIGFGVLAAILSLSGLFAYLLKHQFSATYAFFFGLILISPLIPFKMIKKRNLLTFIAIILGIIAVVMLVNMSNPTEHILEKSQVLQQQIVQNSANASGITFTELFYIFLCGIIAISAMILPGLSGSLVLLVLGKYSLIISSVYAVAKIQCSRDDLLIISSFAIGAFIGLVGFAKIVDFILKKFHDITMAFLTGLVIGSLYSLWPFKKMLTLNNIFIKENGKIKEVAELIIPSNQNILPFSNQIFYPAVAFTIAIFIMLIFTKFEKLKKNEN